MYGQRPLISIPTATSTGCGTTRQLPAAPGAGLQERRELELAIQRRSSRKSTAEAVTTVRSSSAITRPAPCAGRPAEVDRQRRALLVMATDRAKTRTVTALADADALQLGQAHPVPGRPGWRW